jgi:hypothetical protein
MLALFPKGHKTAMLACSFRTEFAIPTEPPAVPSVAVLLILILSFTVPAVCALYQMLRFVTCSGATARTDRRNVTVRSQDRIGRAREEFSETWTMDDDELV